MTRRSPPGGEATSATDLVHKYAYESADRVPLLTYGANSSPERLALKLAHLPVRDHEALILAGDLEGFDVGAVAQPPVFSSMPATLLPSPGTKVRVPWLRTWSRTRSTASLCSSPAGAHSVSMANRSRWQRSPRRTAAQQRGRKPRSSKRLPAWPSARAHAPAIWSKPRTRTPRRSWPSTTRASGRISALRVGALDEDAGGRGVTSFELSLVARSESGSRPPEELWKRDVLS
jgi:hypothetical protein